MKGKSRSIEKESQIHLYRVGGSPIERAKKGRLNPRKGVRDRQLERGVEKREITETAESGTVITASKLPTQRKAQTMVPGRRRNMSA